jgi:hypothetical protein
LATKDDLVTLRAQIRGDLLDLKTILLLWTFGMILSSVVVNVGAIIALATVLTRHGP